jgi:rhamnogalacturonan endolyase
MKILMKKIFGRIPFICLLVPFLASFEGCSSDPAVTVTEDPETYILDNGIVTARIAKASGDLVSLRYKDMEMLATFLTSTGEPDLVRDPPGANPNGFNKGMTDHQYGFWSHDAMGPKGTTPAIVSVTIDPGKNGGKRAEVSVKGVSNGRKMGTGPGSTPEGQFISDIDIRYTLERGEPGIYTYSIFEHKAEYQFTQLGEARFCAKLADFFDWMSVDAKINFNYPKDLHDGDKYIYTTLQSANPAFGWSSTTKNVGLFFINPSMEYMSGAPTKIEFLGHRDTNPVAAPCVLNYWRSSHYGGAEVNVAGGEHWKKVVGPFFIYVNSGPNPEEIYSDARARARVEADKWPYKWVSDADYTKAKLRATVKGQLILNDAIGDVSFSNLMAGLTAPAYVSPRRPGSQSEIMTDWQRDAKFYQFWTKGNVNGSFEITKVRPEKYTLHAFTDGVLGELIKTDVVVEPGRNLNLGELTWTPVRKGNQLWEIGIPNRNASGFFMADKHNDPEISLEYATLFPDDVNYIIGKSDYGKDWFFQHVPHNEDQDAKSSLYFGARSPGRATPYKISFDVSSDPKGTATLRLAICGTGTRYIDVEVNGQSAGKIDNLIGDGVITRHGTQGIWYERELVFDAGLMHAGSNTLVLIVPAGPVNNGIMYDYLRLELE